MTGLAAVLLGAEVYLLGAGRPQQDAVARRPGSFVVGEVAGEITVSQTLTASIAGVDQVTLWPVVDVAPEGPLVFRLYDVTRPRQPEFVFGTSELVGHIGGDQPLVIGVPRLEGSAGRRYRIDLSVPDASPGRGLSFWMHEGESYPLGELTVNGRPQRADLLFRLDAEELSAWSRMTRRLTDDGVPVPGPPVMLALLALTNLCLVAGVERMVAGGPGESDGPSGRMGSAHAVED